MKVCAVIDTNVIVAALLSKKEDAATVRILKELAGGRILPLYHLEILAEYREVLRRDKFPIASGPVDGILKMFLQFGQSVVPIPAKEAFPDPDDRIFYEATLARRSEDAYLVTGNKKHFPDSPFVVTPAEMMAILDAGE